MKRSNANGLSRRVFLRGAGTVLAALSLPLTAVERVAAARRGDFLTRRELRTLTALCDRIIPPDDDPGAGKLGAARYIHDLLRALDRRTPRLFAGGPFSGRNPYPDLRRGRPSRRRPRNEFQRFLPLTDLQELRWRAELFGSATVPELADLDAQRGGPLVGLRDLYRQGLARVDEIARQETGTTFVKLDAAAQDAVFAVLDDSFPADPRRGGRTFMDLLIQHTIEGCFSAPEYGGNARGRGWKMVGLEGDSQPLGFSLYSEELGDYVERPDHPMSTPNPDEIDAPRPLTADGLKVQESIATLAGGFNDGSC
jgi:hypothetical protein